MRYPATWKLLLGLPDFRFFSDYLCTTSKNVLWDKDQHQHFSWFSILHILLLFQATPIFSRNVPTNLILVLCLMLPSDFQPSGIITFSCSTYDHPFGTWAPSTHPSLFVLMTIDFKAGAVHPTSVLNWTTVSNSSCSLEISSALFLTLSISISMLFAT